MSLLPKAYFSGKIVPLEDAKVSIATHSMQYGTGIFGGTRGYYNPEKNCVNIFRLDEHVKRVFNSARIIKVAIPYSKEEVFQAFIDLTKANGAKSNVYFRSMAYKSGTDLTPKLTGVDDAFSIFMLANEDLYATDKGISAMVSAWRRISDNVIPARGKVAGGYINSSLAKDDALLAGFDEAIMLNKDEKVAEGTAANIMMVRDGVLVTPETNSDVLEGIMRRSVIQMARDMGIEVQERTIDRSELYIADEVFFCGTGAQVKSVVDIDKRPVGDGEVGEITKKIYAQFRKIIMNDAPEYADWITSVELD